MNMIISLYTVVMVITLYIGSCMSDEVPLWEGQRFIQEISYI